MNYLIDSSGKIAFVCKQPPVSENTFSKVNLIEPSPSKQTESIHSERQEPSNDIEMADVRRTSHSSLNLVTNPPPAQVHPVVPDEQKLDL